VVAGSPSSTWRWLIKPIGDDLGGGLTTSFDLDVADPPPKTWGGAGLAPAFFSFFCKKKKKINFPLLVLIFLLVFYFFNFLI
jgi:hypothetical protein